MKKGEAGAREIAKRLCGIPWHKEMKTLIRGMSVRMVRKSRYYRQFRGRNERLSSFLTFSGDEVIIHPEGLLISSPPSYSHRNVERPKMK